MSKSKKKRNLSKKRRKRLKKLKRKQQKGVQEDIKKLVIARIKTMPDNLRISIG